MRYLDEQPTYNRSNITKFNAFKSITDKISTKNQKDRVAASPLTSKGIEIKPEVEEFLEAVDWDLEEFIDTYSCVFEAMKSFSGTASTSSGTASTSSGTASTSSVEKHRETRLSKTRSTQMLSMSGLTWIYDSKNRNRDWDGVALAVTIETALIESYRENLLKACPSACRLRVELYDFFLKITPPWNQIAGQNSMLTCNMEKRWIFPDGICTDDISQEVNTHIDSGVLRSQWQPSETTKSGVDLSRRIHRKKKDTIAAAPAKTTTPAPLPQRAHPSKDTSSSTTRAKDTAPHKKSDDIQSVLSSLKSLQKHTLLQCSDPDAPSGSTESIVSFAASIIGHVTIL